VLKLKSQNDYKYFQGEKLWHILLKTVVFLVVLALKLAPFKQLLKAKNSTLSIKTLAFLAVLAQILAPLARLKKNKNRKTGFA
jgi:heme A synthase